MNTAEIEISKKGVIQEKWGTALEAGFQIVPNILIRAQSQLGLDPVDIVVLLNLMSHWWERKTLPFIAPNRIAKRMHVSTRTVERHLKKLEKNGFIRRCKPTRSDDGAYTRAYDLEPLVAVLQNASKNAVLLRKMQKNEFEGLNHEARLAVTEGPQVQYNGDAEPVQRVASPIPTGEGSGNLGPRVASFQDTPQTPAEQEELTRAMLSMPAKFRDANWETSMLGKACPVCHVLFERGHQCKMVSFDDDDAPF